MIGILIRRRARSTAHWFWLGKDWNWERLWIREFNEFHGPMEVSWNRGSLKSSKSLDHARIETHGDLGGDLGVSHFWKPPIANMITLYYIEFHGKKVQTLTGRYVDAPWALGYQGKLVKHLWRWKHSRKSKIVLNAFPGFFRMLLADLEMPSFVHRWIWWWTFDGSNSSSSGGFSRIPLAGYIHGLY